MFRKRIRGAAMRCEARMGIQTGQRQRVKHTSRFFIKAGVVQLERRGVGRSAGIFGFALDVRRVNCQALLATVGEVRRRPWAFGHRQLGVGPRLPSRGCPLCLTGKALLPNLAPQSPNQNRGALAGPSQHPAPAFARSPTLRSRGSVPAAPEFNNEHND